MFSGHGHASGRGGSGVGPDGGMPGSGGGLRDIPGSPIGRSLSNQSDSTILQAISPEVINSHVLETLQVLRTLVGK